MSEQRSAHIVVDDVTMAYGDFLIQRDLNFSVQRGEIFIIMGGSGCGKSTLLKIMIGLKSPKVGEIYYDEQPFWASTKAEQSQLKRKFGTLFQSGALWSSMTLSENIGLALKQYTELSDEEIREVAAYKLALVGLAGFEDYYPSEISGGMKKRAGLARAMAMDPDILFFDEPSAGLDPISAKLLDDLILELRDSLGTTVVIVTHELQSIFAIADNCVFLDADSKTQLATGNPRQLRDHHPDFTVRNFLQRGLADRAESARMSKQPNTPLIGAFVVSAVVLLAIGVMLFGGAELFSRKSYAVAYFPGSVKGLRVGSNVLFRGVRIGFVKDITLMGDAETFDTVVRTTLELTPGVWVLLRDGKPLSDEGAEMIDAERLVDVGLRARLGVESFVTGQLVVELDFLPETEAEFRSLTDDGVTELPTTASNVQQVVEKFQTVISTIDFEKLANDLEGTLKGLNELANSADLRAALAGASRAINSPATQGLGESLETTLAQTRAAVGDFRRLVNQVDRGVEPLLADAGPAMKRLDQALASAEDALAAVDRQLSGDTGLDWELATTLREIRAAARSLRVFLDYLERNPEALIRGKRED